MHIPFLDEGKGKVGNIAGGNRIKTERSKSSENELLEQSSLDYACEVARKNGHTNKEVSLSMGDVKILGDGGADWWNERSTDTNEETG